MSSGVGCPEAARPHSCRCHVVAFSPRQRLPTPSPRGRAPASPARSPEDGTHRAQPRLLHRHARPGWCLKVCPGPSEPGPLSLFSTPVSFQLCRLFCPRSVFAAFRVCSCRHVFLRRVVLNLVCSSLSSFLVPTSCSGDSVYSVIC